MNKILITRASLPLYKKIQDKIQEIAECLEHSNNSSPDLMGGKSGEALFWAYYSKYTGGQDYIDTMTARITEVFDIINNGFTYHTFAGGLAGIGWTVEHLAQNDFIEADTNEIIGPLDEFLYRHMIHDIFNGEYDYLHNALGIGLYFLSRKENPESGKFLEELVNGIDKASIKDRNTIFWEVKLRRESNIRGCNLGLSHGLASIIICLSRFYQAGILPEKIAGMVKGAVNYLLSNRQDVRKYKYHFPAWVCKSEPDHGGRLAWCYNDMGIAIALWQVGNILGNEEWKQEAMDVLVDSTKLTSPDEAGVRDVGICHGAAGVAHIYNRMYRYTGNNLFKNSAMYWFEQCLKMATFNDGPAGYKAYRLPEYGGWQSERGLLEGVAGIGLAMISSVSEIEPEWDTALLLC